MRKHVGALLSRKWREYCTQLLGSVCIILNSCWVLWVAFSRSLTVKLLCCHQ
jgi:hypothetical protein